MERTTEERLLQMEERLAFYEHTGDTFGEAILEMEKRLQKLESENRQLIEEVRRLRECLRDPFNPQMEKPPHY